MNKLTFAHPRRASLGPAQVMALVVALLATSPAAQADPMRPLASLPAAPPAGSVAGAPPAEGLSGGSAPAPAGPALLATRRVGDGPWQALVGERWLKAGDRVDGALVQQVGPGRVVLQQGGQLNTLQWLPALEAVPDPAPDLAPVARPPVAPRPRKSPPQGKP